MRNSLIVAMLTISFLVAGQDKNDVMKTINSLFLAMETNDSTLASTLITENAFLHTVVKDDDGKTRLSTSPASKLVTAFAKPKEEIWSEPIWNEKVEIDNQLASVWVNYAFYRGKEFSHCGVDAFHLIYQDGSWKIFHLVDTRRKENCSIPEKIQSRYR